MEEKPRNARALVLLGVATLVLVLIDQASKAIVLATLQADVVHSFLTIVGYPIFIIERVENPGAFLSLGAGLGGAFRVVILILAPIAALAVLIIYVVRKGLPSPALRAAATLFISGGISNLVDRVARGSVVDFMNVGIGNLRTGIFNVADLFLMSALAIMVIRGLIGVRRKPDSDGA